MSRLKHRVRELYAAGDRSEGTRRCYESCWRSFDAWCSSAGRDSLPASEETVCLYIADRGGSGAIKVGTIHVHLAAIRERHVTAGLAHPVGEGVRRVMAGLSRKRGLLPEPKAAMTPEQLRAMVGSLDRASLQGARDAAILLLGFSTGLRRSDLVALDVEDVRAVPQGLVVAIGRRRREKNDQEGRGRKLAVFPGSRPETCPVLAVERWLDQRGRLRGPLFVRTDSGAGELERLRSQTVWHVVRRAAEAAGLNPREFGAHSLRAGMATAMSAGGASDGAIMARTGHKSPAMVGRYVRHADLFRSNYLAKAL